MQKEPKIVNCRNTKHYTPEIFRKTLSEVFWEHILSCGLTSSQIFYTTEIAPFKQRKVKNSYAPYIDKDLRQTILLQEKTCQIQRPN